MIDRSVVWGGILGAALLVTQNALAQATQGSGSSDPSQSANATEGENESETAEDESVGWDTKEDESVGWDTRTDATAADESVGWDRKEDESVGWDTRTDATAADESVGWDTKEGESVGWDGPFAEDPLPSSKVEVHGMVEGAVGARVAEESATSDELLLAEARARLELSFEADLAFARAKLDFVADEVDSGVRVEVREAQAAVTPTLFWEFAAGRKVLTWGTGDLVFLNDLFPKDFVSFFIGRADEFLKLPATHVRNSLSSRWISWDFVWMPVLQPDRIPNGSRLPYYSPVREQIVAQDETIVVVEPDKRLDSGEFASRIYGTAHSVEWALYGYVGFTKQPVAFDADTNTLGYGRQGVYGASIRYPLLGGLMNLEGAYYDPFERSNQALTQRPSPQVRGLLGYEHELFENATVGAQYYVELEPRATAVDRESRELHFVTVRLSVRALHEDLTMSAFGLYDPKNDDGHARVAASYRVGDAALLTLGSNLMFGKEDSSFFGQFRGSSNVYARARVSF